MSLYQWIGAALVAAGAVSLVAPSLWQRIRSWLAGRRTTSQQPATYWFGVLDSLQTRLEDLGHEKQAEQLNHLYPLLRHPADEEVPR